MALTQWDEVEEENQLKFALAVKGACMNIAGNPADKAQQFYACDVINGTNPPFKQVWFITQAVDNSSFTAGSVAYEDIDLGTISDVADLLGGPIELLAHAKYLKYKNVDPI